MCITLIKNRKYVDFVLIDTFSTINFYYAYTIAQLARFFKLKYIPILHGGNLPYRLDHSLKMSQAIFNHSFTNIAPSGYLQYEFNKRGFSTTLIPNILNIKDYPFKQRNSLQPKLLWVRAFAHLYNPALAILVLKELKITFPKAKLCMIGPVKDDSYELTKDLVKKLDLVSSVEFTGVLPKEQWHKKSKEFDVFINTTNFDNTPVSVMEAMALGLPVVSTNVGGLPYLIENNKDGVLVDKDDIPAMTKAVINLIEDKQKAVDVALKARKKVENFDWKFVKQQWDIILLDE
jgi:glycosyltransferase involved in cell wall biosynthesis